MFVCYTEKFLYLDIHTTSWNQLFSTSSTTVKWGVVRSWPPRRLYWPGYTLMRLILLWGIYWLSGTTVCQYRPQHCCLLNFLCRWTWAPSGWAWAIRGNHPKYQHLSSPYLFCKQSTRKYHGAASEFLISLCNPTVGCNSYEKLCNGHIERLQYFSWGNAMMGTRMVGPPADPH